MYLLLVRPGSSKHTVLELTGVGPRISRGTVGVGTYLSKDEVWDETTTVRYHTVSATSDTRREGLGIGYYRVTIEV